MSMIGKDMSGENQALYFTAHPRSFEDFRYVYPVVSRRAGGISLGVNLNLDKTCNFHCIYCQVDRPAWKKGLPMALGAESVSAPGLASASTEALHTPPEDSPLPETKPAPPSLGERPNIFIDLQRLTAELESILQLWRSGQLFTIRPFSGLPPELRRLNDIALSGDGEPTLYRNFPQIVACCAEVRRRHRLEDLKLVLITNASLLDQPHVQEGLALLDQNNGEIWAKLDAGSEDYFRQVARTKVPLERIVRNIQEAARLRPLVIQSLFMRIAGQGPSVEEQAAYCQRLQEILEAGGRIKLVQIYTIARAPAEPIVSALPPEDLQAIAALVRQTTGLLVAVFPAPEPSSADSNRSKSS